MGYGPSYCKATTLLGKLWCCFVHTDSPVILNCPQCAGNLYAYRIVSDPSLKRPIYGNTEFVSHTHPMVVVLHALMTFVAWEKRDKKQLELIEEQKLLRADATRLQALAKTLVQLEAEQKQDGPKKKDDLENLREVVNTARQKYSKRKRSFEGAQDAFLSMFRDVSDSARTFRTLLEEVGEWSSDRKSFLEGKVGLGGEQLEDVMDVGAAFAMVYWTWKNKKQAFMQPSPPPHSPPPPGPSQSRPSSQRGPDPPLPPQPPTGGPGGGDSQAFHSSGGAPGALTDFEAYVKQTALTYGGSYFHDLPSFSTLSSNSSNSTTNSTDDALSSSQDLTKAPHTPNDDLPLQSLSNDYHAAETTPRSDVSDSLSPRTSEHVLAIETPDSWKKLDESPSRLPAPVQARNANTLDPSDDVLVIPSVPDGSFPRVPDGSAALDGPNSRIPGPGPDSETSHASPSHSFSHSLRQSLRKVVPSMRKAGRRISQFSPHPKIRAQTQA